MSLSRFLYMKGNTSNYVNLISEAESGTCVISDLSVNGHLSFSIDSSMCFSVKDVLSWIETFEPKKLVVDQADTVDKNTLGSILEAAKQRNIDIDFYGRRVDLKGLISDSSEYLLVHCSEIRPAF